MQHPLLVVHVLGAIDLGELSKGLSDAFSALLFVALIAIFVMICVVVVSLVAMVLHVITTIVLLYKKKYREKGPGILNRVLTIPGIVAPAIFLSVMLDDGLLCHDGTPLLLFTVTTGLLFLVWFGPWLQHAGAISEKLEITKRGALHHVLQQNKVRFCFTIGVPLLLVMWVTAANL